MTTTGDTILPILHMLCPPGQVKERGIVLVLTSPVSRCGTSFVARKLALLAAEQHAPYGQRVSLVDFDLNQQTHGAVFDSRTFQATYGALQGPYDATLGVKPFWQVSPEMASGDAGRAQTLQTCQMFLVGEKGLAITRFNWKAVRAGQTVHIVRSPEYWDAYRQNFALTIIDAPAFDRSDTALSTVADTDYTIMVVPSDQDYVAAANTANENISAAGGKCAGLIENAGSRLHLHEEAAG